MGFRAVVRAGGRLLTLVSFLVGSAVEAPSVASAQTPTPSPRVSLGPCTGAHCPRSGGFWIVFVILAGLLVIYRLWLLRRR